MSARTSIDISVISTPSTISTITTGREQSHGETAHPQPPQPPLQQQSGISPPPSYRTGSVDESANDNTKRDIDLEAATQTAHTSNWSHWIELSAFWITVFIYLALTAFIAALALIHSNDFIYFCKDGKKWNVLFWTGVGQGLSIGATWFAIKKVRQLAYFAALFSLGICWVLGLLTSLPGKLCPPMPP